MVLPNGYLRSGEALEVMALGDLGLWSLVLFVDRLIVLDDVKEGCLITLGQYHYRAGAPLVECVTTPRVLPSMASCMRSLRLKPAASCKIMMWQGFTDSLVDSGQFFGSLYHPTPPDQPKSPKLKTPIFNLNKIGTLYPCPKCLWWSKQNFR